MAKNKSNNYFWIFLIIVAALFGYLIGMKGSGKFSIDLGKSSANVTAPLTILSPNGGERLQLGSKGQIKFKFSEVPADGTWLGAILYKGGDAKHVPVMLGVINSIFLTPTYIRDNGYTMNWTMGQYRDVNGKDRLVPVGNDYTISLIANTSQGTVGFDATDNQFSIVK